MTEKKGKPVTAEEVAELFKCRGLTRTSEWITFSIKNKLATEKDFVRHSRFK